MYRILFKLKGPMSTKLHWCLWQLLIDLKQFSLAMKYRIKFFNDQYLMPGFKRPVDMEGYCAYIRSRYFNIYQDDDRFILPRNSRLDYFTYNLYRKYNIL